MERYIKEIDIILIFGIEIQLIINKKYKDLTSSILGDHFNFLMVVLYALICEVIKLHFLLNQ